LPVCLIGRYGRASAIIIYKFKLIGARRRLIGCRSIRAEVLVMDEPKKSLEQVLDEVEKLNLRKR
jgi:hypothetical protein